MPLSVVLGLVALGCASVALANHNLQAQTDQTVAPSGGQPGQGIVVPPQGQPYIDPTVTGIKSGPSKSGGFFGGGKGGGFGGFSRGPRGMGGGSQAVMMQFGKIMAGLRYAHEEEEPEDRIAALESIQSQIQAFLNDPANKSSLVTKKGKDSRVAKDAKRELKRIAESITHGKVDLITRQIYEVDHEELTADQINGAIAQLKELQNGAPKSLARRLNNDIRNLDRMVSDFDRRAREEEQFAKMDEERQRGEDQFAPFFGPREEGDRDGYKSDMGMMGGLGSGMTSGDINQMMQQMMGGKMDNGPMPPQGDMANMNIHGPTAGPGADAPPPPPSDGAGAPPPPTGSIWDIIRFFFSR